MRDSVDRDAEPFITLYACRQLGQHKDHDFTSAALPTPYHMNRPRDFGLGLKPEAVRIRLPYARLAIMRSTVWTAMIFLVVGATALVGADFELRITKKTLLKGDLEDLVTFGGIKEMTCNSDGNIFSASNRKYGSALNAVIRFTPDARFFETFSIDGLKDLGDGTIIDFDLGPNGQIQVLARQVLKYSKAEVPVEFGKTFLIHYDKSGGVLSNVEFKVDTDNFSPTGFAAMGNGDFMVVGYYRADDKTFLIAEVLSGDGSLKARLDLNPSGTRTSKGKTVASERVLNPAAIKANGLIYVLRGTTTEPVYVFSETEKLVRTVQLKPPDTEFDSPKILGDRLIVREHSPFSEADDRITIRRAPKRINLPVFSLDTGTMV